MEGDESWWLPATPDAELVRFGRGEPHILAAQAWKYASGRGDGTWGLSEWWWPDKTPEEIVWHAYRTVTGRGDANPFLQSVFRTWHRPALHDFDFLIQIRKTFGPGHYTVELPSFILEQDYEPAYHRDRQSFPAYECNADYFDQLSALLSPPIRNPVRSL